METTEFMDLLLPVRCQQSTGLRRTSTFTQNLLIIHLTAAFVVLGCFTGLAASIAVAVVLLFTKAFPCFKTL